jgi:AcrR family transcriptional regulator
MPKVLYKSDDIGSGDEKARQPPADPSLAVVDRITEATYRCIELYGYAKTTMEAIARQAGFSRGTVYNYFSSKDEILERIRFLESQKINIQIRKRMRRFDAFPDLLTEAMFLATRIAHENPYIRGMVNSLSYMSMSAHPSSPGHKHIGELWGKLLISAQRDGELATDQTIDQVLSWLFLSHYMLLAKVEAADIRDDELRAFIRRYVVKPLLPDRT